jgi:hypothetical protein
MAGTSATGARGTRCRRSRGASTGASAPPSTAFRSTVPALTTSTAMRSGRRLCCSSSGACGLLAAFGNVRFVPPTVTHGGDCVCAVSMQAGVRDGGAGDAAERESARGAHLGELQRGRAVLHYHLLRILQGTTTTLPPCPCSARPCWWCAFPCWSTSIRCSIFRPLRSSGEANECPCTDGSISLDLLRERAAPRAN